MIELPLHTIAGIVGADLVPATGPSPGSASARMTVAAVSTDTRVASDLPALFVALRTDSADGHEHVAAAAAAGAVAVLVEHARRDVDLPQLVVPDTWAALRALARDVVDRSGARRVGITGSYGKTTTKDLAAAALGAGRRTVAARASYNNELGVPLTMLSVAADTEVLVAELGARLAGDLAVTAGLLRPDVSVVTAVGPVHLETFGDLDGVAQEKSQVVRALGPDGVAVLNADDGRVAAMRPAGRETLLVSAAGLTSADLRARAVDVDTVGRVRAEVVTPWGDVALQVPLPGRHHLTNALLALAVAGAEGVDIQAAAAAIATAPTSASRAVLREVAGVRVIDDAYNASAPTMLGALRTLEDLPCDGRRWAVLGRMAELGETSVAQHRSVGEACGDLDLLIVVDGGDAAAIAAGAASVGLPASRCRRVATLEALDALLAAEVRPGDAVLFKASRVVGLDRSARALMAALEGSTGA